MSEWSQGSHKMWTEVSSSVPYFLQAGLLLSPIIYKCLLKVLCPVRRPITTLDCVLLKDNNWALVARSGPEINSLACLCVLQGPCHNTRCWFSIQCFIFLSIFWLETPRKGSGCYKDCPIISGGCFLAYFVSTNLCHHHVLLQFWHNIHIFVYDITWWYMNWRGREAVSHTYSVFFYIVRHVLSLAKSCCLPL
jgi:hypothetical protein